MTDRSDRNSIEWRLPRGPLDWRQTRGHPPRWSAPGYGRQSYIVTRAFRFFIRILPPLVILSLSFRAHFAEDQVTRLGSSIFQVRTYSGSISADIRSCPGGWHYPGLWEYKVGAPEADYVEHMSQTVFRKLGFAEVSGTDGWVTYTTVVVPFWSLLLASMSLSSVALFARRACPPRQRGFLVGNTDGTGSKKR